MAAILSRPQCLNFLLIWDKVQFVLDIPTRGCWWLNKALHHDLDLSGHSGLTATLFNTLYPPPSTVAPCRSMTLLGQHHLVSCWWRRLGIASLTSWGGRALTRFWNSEVVAQAQIWFYRFILWSGLQGLRICNSTGPIGSTTFHYFFVW